ncbi:hypothetical protein EVAR_2429_1 [Eumeta japonica]|uniref:Uncharacterized protein n=1 Tax=Eumeta variegata TaxID=151549 RepID=A0A4C1SQT8_EUMVA|nr:hypothetical protein EVAR_2429_1 [Eumeta japonica]
MKMPCRCVTALWMPREQTPQQSKSRESVGAKRALKRDAGRRWRRSVSFSPTRTGARVCGRHFLPPPRRQRKKKERAISSSAAADGKTRRRGKQPTAESEASLVLRRWRFILNYFPWKSISPLHIFICITMAYGSPC